MLFEQEMKQIKKEVLIACSGGPDSMALLDMYKNKKKVIVCHINYHKRKTAKRDENIPLLVNQEQAKFIRNYRWKKIKEKIL